MQLFRSQLSRFTPHPHHDSWMRNHQKQWLNILRWCSCLTLVAAGWLTYFHRSPIGELFSLDEVLSQWLPALNASVISYIMLGISLFFGLSGILSFRCGDKKKTRYNIPVIISGFILLATLVLHLATSGLSFFKATALLLPIATPFMLIRYAGWKNQLDNWSVLVCLFTSITIIGYALLNLKSTAGFMTYTGDRFTLSDLSPAQINVITSSICYLALFGALAVYIPKLRRVALYITILLGLAAIIGNVMGASSSSLSYSISLILFLISYCLFPILILLSLASRKKSRTLRF